MISQRLSLAEFVNNFPNLTCFDLARIGYSYEPFTKPAKSADGFSPACSQYHSAGDT